MENLTAIFKLGLKPTLTIVSYVVGSFFSYEKVPYLWSVFLILAVVEIVLMVIQLSEFIDDYRNTTTQLNNVNMEADELAAVNEMQAVQLNQINNNQETIIGFKRNQ